MQIRQFHDAAEHLGVCVCVCSFGKWMFAWAVWTRAAQYLVYSSCAGRAEGALATLVEMVCEAAVTPPALSQSAVSIAVRTPAELHARLRAAFVANPQLLQQLGLLFHFTLLFDDYKALGSCGSLRLSIPLFSTLYSYPPFLSPILSTLLLVYSSFRSSGVMIVHP